MSKPKPKTLQPRDFQLNRTWLAYRINQAPIQVEGLEIDLYILQDAGSMFIFGNVLAQHGAEYPKSEDVEKLLLSAHSRRNEWPAELLLPGAPRPDNSFIRIAKKLGFEARTVPESQMSFYIKDTQEAYEEFLSRDAGDAYLAQAERQRQATLARPEVRGTFSQSGPRRPAAVARVARTLGLTKHVLLARPCLSHQSRTFVPMFRQFLPSKDSASPSSPEELACTNVPLIVSSGTWRKNIHPLLKPWKR